MGWSNVARLLDQASKNGYTAKIPTYSVESDQIIEMAGSYYADASAGDLFLKLADAISEQGSVVDVKKIDPSGWRVVVLAPNTGTIEGDSSIELIAQGESVTLMLHANNWYVR
jgi:hypothetical protein